MKKLITKALIEIFLLGIVITMTFNLGLQFLKAELTFKNMTEGYFEQIGEMLDLNNASEQPKTVSQFFEKLPSVKKSTFFIIDPQTNVILGSTNRNYTGQNTSDVGVDVSNVTEKAIGEFQTINGRREYCVLQRIGDHIMVHSCQRKYLFKGIFGDALLLCAYISSMFLLLLVTCYSFMDRRIIRSIIKINTQLKKIDSGNYNVTLDDEYTEELAELCQSINSMTGSLLSFTEKISKALELSGVPIGIFEYNVERNRIVGTSRVKDILMLTEEENQNILSHPESIENWKEELFCTDSDLGPHIYRLKKHRDHYIRVEMFSYDSSKIVVLIDVTASIEEKHAIVKERDTDILTGLYNSRAGFRMLDVLFEKTEERKHAVIFMIDLDHLKYVNDNYGHAGGDQYIETFANVLSSCELNHTMIARMGGDEFCLLAYGFEGVKEARVAIDWMYSIRNRHSVTMENGDEIALEFSMGYAFCPDEEASVKELMKLADSRMYEDKRNRKAGRE